MNQNKLTSLFIQQSLRDAENDYANSLCSEAFPHFDVVALTASNEHQAEAFRRQLAIRELPPFTEFVVIPDKNGERVGSGGATLSVIKYIKEKYGSLKGLSIACIHSGGDSKRTPTYSAMGKLFSPVPRTLPNGKPSTLFDEFLIAIASVPGRMREGMLLLSGDVLLLFNPLQIDFSGEGAAAISFKEDAETGKDHGVYLSGESGNVKKFLHKQSLQTLNELGAVNASGKVSIDTGAVIFSTGMLEDLYRLVESEAGEARFINPVTRLSLYGDFLYPLAEDSTLEAFYAEKPEGEFCRELREAREAVWQVLRPYRMKLLHLAPAKFIHFGTTKEVLELMAHGVADYESIGWSRHVNSSIKSTKVSGYNAALSGNAEVGEGSYLEVSYVHGNAKVGKHCLISFAELHDVTVPDACVLHVLKLLDGRFVCRIYGTEDNPKENMLFGRPLDKPLWDEVLYPVCQTVDAAVAASMNLYEIIVNGTGDREAWEKAEKRSLRSGFLEADPQALIQWSVRMEDYVRMDDLSACIEEGRPAREGKTILKGTPLSIIQEQWLEKKTGTLDASRLKDFSHLIRLYYYLGAATGDERLTAKCFHTIAETILRHSIAGLQFDGAARICRDEVTVHLPLRVNWGGGWTDTPPYCLENGGVVLNAAVSLRGRLPVEVTIKKLPDRKIVFISRDMGVHGEFTELIPLQQTGDPYDPYVLQKACLLACGLIPKREKRDAGPSLGDLLDRLGGGFEMHTEVQGVPKGSGLGTSSILAAACVKAVLEFIGRPYTENDLYATVLAMEQLMSTGGGWQDQVGGVTNGIKFISSEPGFDQLLRVDHVLLSEKTKQELQERFCLIYTGQRRLARNLLRDVVGRYVGNEEESLFAHKEIQKVAVLMRFALERGNIDEFARLLEEHWVLSKKIDAGSTNTLLDQIFLGIEDMIDGRMVCGAGGGGFLQVILKKGVRKEAVHQRLKEIFQDFDVDVWESEFVY